jgi:hypothetical protein
MNEYEMKEEFKTAVEIAEVACKEGNRTRAAYWIGQATVYANLYTECENTSYMMPLPEMCEKHFNTWVQLRSLYQR